MNTPWQETTHYALPKGASLNTILKEGNLDWEIKTLPITSESGAKTTDFFALERCDIKKIFSVVGRAYEPKQNIDIIRGFMEICEVGYMKPIVAGQFHDGKRIWLLAKMDKDFMIGDDVVEAHVLMSHSHQYGKGTDINVMPLRVASQSTIVLDTFEGENATETYDYCKKAMAEFQQNAQAFVDSKILEKDVREMAMQLFYPDVSDYLVLKEQAQKLVDIYRDSPGSHLWDGTWWKFFNCYCYMVDHQMGRDRRFSLESAWFGPRAVDKRNTFYEVAKATMGIRDTSRVSGVPRI